LKSPEKYGRKELARRGGSTQGGGIGRKGIRRNRTETNGGKGGLKRREYSGGYEVGEGTKRKQSKKEKNCSIPKEQGRTEQLKGGRE